MTDEDFRENLEYFLWLRGWKGEVLHHHVGPWKCFKVRIFDGEGWIEDEVHYYWAIDDGKGRDLDRCIHRLRWLWWRGIFHRYVSLDRANHMATWLFGPPRLAVLSW